MSVQLKIRTMEIYSDYIKRREAGARRDDVIRQLQPEINRLPEAGWTKLREMILAWEQSHVADVQPAPQPPPGPACKNPESLNHFQPIQRETTVACPACGRLNRKEDTVCSTCGFDLNRAMSFRTRKFSGNSPDTRLHTIKLAEHTAFVLNIRGSDRPRLVVLRRDMTIGRAVQGSSSCPDIDLSPYNAEELGVSRLHAMFTRRDNTLMLIDLNSVNHTHINGQRLFPNERRALHDGDQIRLGEMVMVVVFKD